MKKLSPLAIAALAMGGSAFLIATLFLFMIGAGALALNYDTSGSKTAGTTTTGSATGAADTEKPIVWTGSTKTVDKLGKLTIPHTSGGCSTEDHMTNYATYTSPRDHKHYEAGTECFKSKGDVHLINKYSKATYCGAFTMDYNASGSICTGTDTHDDETCGSYSPRTPLQEMWYFNEKWSSGAVAHKKVIIKANGKAVVASIEEYGPASFTGNIAGASKEIANYLGFGKSNKITVGFAEDQDIPLGILY